MGGFIGVDIFFVLSGYLITSSLLREVESTGRLGLAGFYARRVRRLLPASALALAATAVGVSVGLPSSMWRAFGFDIVSAAGYVVNWRLAARSVDYLAQDVAASPVQHFWSLAIEEQFYLVWPALIVFALWLAVRSRLQRSTVIALVLGLVVLVPTFVAAVVYPSPASAFFVTWTRLWEMAFGALAAVVSKRIVVSGGPSWMLAKLIALAAIGVAAVLAGDWSPWPGWWTLVPIVATSVLVVAGAGGDDLVHRGLSVRPMQRIGAWSYSLYLWHWPPLAILAIRRDGLSVSEALLVTLAASVVAVAAFRWVENPVRFHPALRASNALTLTLGVALTLAGIVAGLSLSLMVPTAPATATGGLGARVLAADPGINELLRQIEGAVEFTPIPELAVEDRPALADERCQVERHFVDPVVCERGLAAGPITVMVVGDSKVAQWDSALDAVGSRFGWRVLMVVKSACELTLGEANWNSEPYPECREWSERVIDLIETERPELVLTSQISASGWLDEDNPTDPDAVVDGMLAAYAEVERLGARVVMLEDNPHAPFSVRDCAAEHRETLAECAFDPEGREAGSMAQRRVADEGGYVLVSMADQICPYDVCLPVIGRVLVYRDATHLTDSYVMSMSDVLAERLGALVEG